MSKWVAYYGVPSCILNDNGGEFTADEVVAMKGALNVVNLTTGANSPWQNGTCERNHAVMIIFWKELKMIIQNLI